MIFFLIRVVKEKRRCFFVLFCFTKSQIKRLPENITPEPEVVWKKLRPKSHSWGLNNLETSVEPWHSPLSICWEIGEKAWPVSLGMCCHMKKWGLIIVSSLFSSDVMGLWRHFLPSGLVRTVVKGGWEEMEKSSSFHPSKKTEWISWVPATTVKEHEK